MIRRRRSGVIVWLADGATFGHEISIRYILQKSRYLPLYVSASLSRISFIGFVEKHSAK